MLPTALPTPTRTLVFRPTATHSQTPIPSATATEEIIPSATIAPTATSNQITLEDLPIRLGESKSVEDGGFSFRTIIGYNTELSRRQATLISDDGEVVLSLSGIPVHNVGDLNSVMERFLDKMSETIREFESGQPYPINIDGDRGLAAEVTGEMGGEEVVGRVAIVAPTDEQLFYALAITLDGPTGRGWESRGMPVFETVIETIDFFEPRP
jgi:hypothetical protein